jgi:hypothetical protein
MCDINLKSTKPYTGKRVAAVVTDFYGERMCLWTLPQHI